MAKEENVLIEYLYDHNFASKKYYRQLSLRRTPLGRSLLAVLERCPSYRESNKGSKERQGPTLGVRFTEVSIL